MNYFQAQFIAQSIGQAFQVAYMEFLKANGIEDHSFVKEMDYQEVLNSQEIFGDELAMFAKKELQKEVSQSNHVQSEYSDYLRACHASIYSSVVNTCSSLKGLCICIKNQSLQFPLVTGGGAESQG